MDTRIITNEELKEDSFEKNIRPNSLDEYIGQSEIKENLSVFIKPLYIVCILTINDINIAIKIILFVFAPIHIIIIGPNATFGRLFNIVK